MSVSTTMKLLSALMIIGVLSETESRQLENGMSRIMYGERVDIEDYPYMVQLSMGCGGSLITRQIVLTAAHCLLNASNTLRQNVSVEIKVTGEKIAASMMFPHEKFEKNPDRITPHDIALVYLESPATFNYEFPVLNHQKNFQEPGTTIEVIGYGVTEEGQLSNYLRGTELRISSEQHPFRQAFFAFSEISGSCRGDSGGPAIVRNGQEHILVGVVSGGPVKGKVCLPNTPQSFTSVSDFYDWVRHTIITIMMMN